VFAEILKNPDVFVALLRLMFAASPEADPRIKAFPLLSLMLEPP